MMINDDGTFGGRKRERPRVGGGSLEGKLKLIDILRPAARPETFFLGLHLDLYPTQDLFLWIEVRSR